MGCPMKRALLTLSILVGFSHVASAYEYRLQFTPQSGARGLIVAGYEFDGTTVTGNCSYYTSRPCSGRGCHSVIVHHDNTCTWDPYGNLLSMTPGAPTAPAPLYQSGSEIVYATAGASSTGLDIRNFGFVDTPSSHYTWQTPNGSYAGIPAAVYPITATLISDGDFDLAFGGATVASQTFGMVTPTAGDATVADTTCGSTVPIGATCTVTISYDPTTIACTASPYGYAYTGIDLALATDAGTNKDFSQRFTVAGVPICDD
jgi:hypothetical protein